MNSNKRKRENGKDFYVLPFLKFVNEQVNDKGLLVTITIRDS